MTKGNAGMKRPGKGIGRNYKNRTKKATSRIEKNQRNQKVGVDAYLHIFIYILLLSERDRESRKNQSRVEKEP